MRPPKGVNEHLPEGWRGPDRSRPPQGEPFDFTKFCIVVVVLFFVIGSLIALVMGG